jgi:hypothetical protein
LAKRHAGAKVRIGSTFYLALKPKLPWCFSLVKTTAPLLKKFDSQTAKRKIIVPFKDIVSRIIGNFLPSRSKILLFGFAKGVYAKKTVGHHPSAVASE